MGLLDKLWDDTLAGPQPDSGLGRLRKPFSSSVSRPSARDEAAAAGVKANSSYCGADDPAPEEAVPRVTRSIMIKRPPGWASPGSGATPPSSPAGSTPPVSPFSGGREWNRFSRRSMSDAYGRRGEAASAPTSSNSPLEV